ncbi:Hypothetical predicted protein [Octopus vulgaris]|uniref:Uncharacterized protein n=1 Tax=Octopus vulgaris TaxID=6645 RepID=A0AA36B9G0_OCTVU|nr:Hypothetical predicted protein [Octopus vulgaris]
MSARPRSSTYFCVSQTKEQHSLLCHPDQRAAPAFASALTKSSTSIRPSPNMRREAFGRKKDDATFILSSFLVSTMHSLFFHSLLIDNFYTLPILPTTNQRAYLFIHYY